MNEEHRASTLPPAVRRRAVPPGLAEEFLELMPRLKRRFEAGLPEDLRQELASVTPHQIEALCHLGSDRGATMHDLARAQGCGMSSATSLADRLLKQGLAERVSDAEDRRVVRLVPTEQAATLISRFRASRRRTALEALSALDDEEVRQLIELLRKVAGEGSA
jgi:DNA-binding MarR family transcriptional regulator